MSERWHNRNMRRTSLFLIFIVCGSFLVAPVFAQKAVDPTLYSAIKQRIAVDDFLQGRDPTTLTQEEIQAMLTQAVVTSRIQQVGDIVATGSAATATTGLTGMAIGKLPKGLYEVSMNPVADIALTVPKEFLVHSEADNTLTIGMQEKKGKGSVTYGPEKIRPSPRLGFSSKNPIQQAISNFQATIINFVARIVPSLRSPQQQLARTSPAQEVAGVSATTLPVRVQLYRDSNGNGKFDQGEKSIPWAQVRVALKKISKE